MENITKLETLYKRDTTGKIRIWEVEYGYTGDTAGTRTISGTQDGQKVTSEWNLSTPKNVGKVNATTALTQAEAEAKALWDKKAEKEYFTDVNKLTLMKSLSQCWHKTILKDHRVVDTVNQS